jgi:hypothetical protein
MTTTAAMVAGWFETQESKMNLKLIVAGALLTFGLATPALAAPGGHGPYGGGPRHSQWELVGSTQVSFRTERDTIRVHGNERHRQIMVCVYNKPVRFLDMDVRFGNGRNQDVGVRSVINPGQCTRAIDLNGRNRDIRSVSFAYKTIPGFRQIGRFAQPATVRVYAR